MKRWLLVLAVLLPFPVIASRVQEQPGLRGSVREDTSSTREAGNVPAEPGGSPPTRSASGPEPDALPQTSKPAKSKKPKEPPKPPIEGSMVGYIDNAIVGSQVRVRFDAAFHNNAPDRAEFFYPQCSCINGPGPNSVVANLNFQQFYLRGEYAATRRLSFFTEIPVRWIQPQLEITPSDSSPFPNQAGLSDIAAGFKLAAVASSNEYLTFQFQAYFPSGNGSRGLGTKHYSVEPALLYYRKLSDRVTLEAELGDLHPIGGSSCLQPCNTGLPVAQPPKSEGFAGDVFFYGVGPSYVLYRGENVRIAPAIELVGWRVLGGFETNQPNAAKDVQKAVSADGTNIVNLKVGARTSLGRSNSFYLGFGQAVTHSVWYEHIVRAEYRYSF